MYRYKKSEHKKIKNFFKISILIILTSIISILLYKEYEKIDINTYDENTSKTTIRTIQTVENVKEQSKQVADIVEEVTSCVVGISKIKNAGNTIFLNDGASKLGLGTGVIISEDGYILSNEHVT